jgi:hypothetical protein
VCNAGVETNFVSFTPPVPISQGWYYPNVRGWLTITVGATPPTAINLAFRVNSGADINVWSTFFGIYPANASVQIPFFTQASSFVQPYPLGVFNLQVSAIPAAQPVTIRTSGTIMFGQWLRAPDQ